MAKYAVDKARGGKWVVLTLPNDFKDGDLYPAPQSSDKYYDTESEAIEELNRRMEAGEDEMALCACKSLNHPEHPGQACGAEATEPDGYCKACHDRRAKEAALSQPDTPPLPPGTRR